MTRRSSEESSPPWVTLACVCASVRRLGRLATRLYDAEMRPAEIEVGQFALLATIRRVPGISQAHIARGLGMDTTSLTRTLDVLLKHGWVEKAQGSDRRSRKFTITRAGETRLLEAVPHWKRAQARFTSIVGTAGVTALVEAVETAALALNTELAPLPRARGTGRTTKRKGRAR